MHKLMEAKTTTAFGLSAVFSVVRGHVSSVSPKKKRNLVICHVLVVLWVAPIESQSNLIKLFTGYQGKEKQIREISGYRRLQESSGQRKR